jgi:hypothetical protein
VADEACVDGGAECESDEHVSDDDGGAGGMGGDDGGAGGMGGELVRLLQEEVARLKATQAATSALLEQQEKIGGRTEEDVRLLQERLRTAMAEAERSAKKSEEERTAAREHAVALAQAMEQTDAAMREVAASLRTAFGTQA